MIFLYNFLWRLVATFFRPIFYLVPTLKERIKDEKKSVQTVLEINKGKSTHTHEVDLCFEISSEGELEEVLPMIYYFLSKESKVHLFYCSKSVAHRCFELRDYFPNFLTITLLPVLTHSFLPWDTGSLLFLKAKALILCRYDFFPNLMSYGLKKDVFFVLASAYTKNKQSFFWRMTYGQFSLIYGATPIDTRFLKNLNLKNTNVRDDLQLRTLQITGRISNSQSRLTQISIYFSLIEFIRQKDRKERLIWGSVYLQDIEALFSDQLLKMNHIHLLVPHQLNKDYVDQLKNLIFTKVNEYVSKCHGMPPESKEGREFSALYIDEQFLQDYELMEENQELSLFTNHGVLFHNKNSIHQLISKAHVIILAIRGHLTELYSFFGTAYVGGGYHASAHSLFEPFLANSLVLTGKNIDRSSEFDFIYSKNSHRISIIKNSNDFVMALEKSTMNDRESDSHAEIQSYVDDQRQKCIDLCEGIYNEIS